MPGDWDGDGTVDRAVYRPSSGRWYLHGFTGSIAFGSNGDVPVPEDFDVDVGTEITVYRPSTGRWYLLGLSGSIALGQAGDIPVPADYEGDGIAELAVFRPSTGQWIIGGYDPISFGTSGDVPVPADYDGDTDDDLRDLSAVDRRVAPAGLPDDRDLRHVDGHPHAGPRGGVAPLLRPLAIRDHVVPGPPKTAGLRRRSSGWQGAR